MNFKYKCLVLDHDDTVVDSTRNVHYPSFLESISILRPGTEMSLEEYFEMNSNSGILPYYRDVAKLTDEELSWEFSEWKKYIANHIPPAYDGMKDLLWNFKNDGGYICVVSHNVKENIIQDYKKNNLPLPDLIYGNELPKELVKPAVFPIIDILEKLNIAKSDMVMIDDLIPGYEMATNSGIDFIAAAWGHETKTVKEFFERNNVFTADSIDALYKILKK